MLKIDAFLPTQRIHDASGTAKIAIVAFVLGAVTAAFLGGLPAHAQFDPRPFDPKDDPVLVRIIQLDARLRRLEETLRAAIDERARLEAERVRSERPWMRDIDRTASEIIERMSSATGEVLTPVEVRRREALAERLAVGVFRGCVDGQAMFTVETANDVSEVFFVDGREAALVNEDVRRLGRCEDGNGRRQTAEAEARAARAAAADAVDRYIGTGQ